MNGFPSLPQDAKSDLDLNQNLISIHLTRSTGEIVVIGQPHGELLLTKETPPVGRMVDDWGAICEVFKQSATYFLTCPGVRLMAGDQIHLIYMDRPALVLRVLDMEQGRAHVETPVTGFLSNNQP